MKFNDREKDYIFNFIELSEVFFVKYLQDAPSEAIKVYLYVMYLNKKSKETTLSEISEEVSLPKKVVQDSLNYWEEKGLLFRKSSGFEIKSLQEIELLNRFNPKVIISIEEVQEKLSNREKEQILRDINNKFFGGTMASTWYGRIVYWMEKYNFTEDAMLAIFQYCFSTGPKNIQYLETVTEAYHKEGIKTYMDFANHIQKNDTVRAISNYIKKKLNLYNNLTKPQENYVKKWAIEYGFTKDVFDILFDISVNKNDIGFNYYDKILKSWHKNGLKTKKDIKKYLEENKLNKLPENKINKNVSSETTKKSKIKENEIRNEREFVNLDELME